MLASSFILKESVRPESHLQLVHVDANKIVWISLTSLWSVSQCCLLWSPDKSGQLHMKFLVAGRVTTKSPTDSNATCATGIRTQRGLIKATNRTMMSVNLQTLQLQQQHLVRSVHLHRQSVKSGPVHKLVRTALDEVADDNRETQESEGSGSKITCCIDKRMRKE